MSNDDADAVIYTPEIPELLKIKDGKVRSIFGLEDGLWLMVASDRISARDVVLRPGIPRKGWVLNTMSTFFFARTAGFAPNHLVDERNLSAPLRRRFDELYAAYPWLAGRAMIVRSGEVVPVEFIFRTRITGSFLAAYNKAGGFEAGATVQRIKCLPGMKEGDPFPGGPIFTPSTKAPSGQHDVNVSPEEAVEYVRAKAGWGLEKARRVVEWGRLVGTDLTKWGDEYCLARGFVLADDKLEVVLVDGELLIGDELFTPDSSRFWRLADYNLGKLINYDKEPVRRWLDEHWDGEGQPPELPPEVVGATSERYQIMRQALMG